MPSSDGNAGIYSRYRFILPVIPIDMMRREIAGDSRTNGREERLLAKMCKQSEPLQLVLDWIFELGKNQFYAFFVQRFMQLDKHIG